MSLEDPEPGECFVWYPPGMGKVFCSVKRPMIRGKKPRVTFTLFTWFTTWERTFAYPLPPSLHKEDWVYEDVKQEGTRERDRV